MNPVKSFVPTSAWLLRICVLVLVYQKYFDTFLTFSMKGVYFFFALSFVVFAVLLFIGGFINKHWLSVMSGFFIFGMSAFLLFWGGTINADKVFNHLLLIALGFVFLARGNG
ncbi:MAG: hypothetical protein QM786_12965 [Breznakibacter sp.]